MTTERRGASLSFLLSSLHQELLIAHAMFRGGTKPAGEWTPEIRNVLILPTVTRLSSLGLALIAEVDGAAREAAQGFVLEASRLIEAKDATAMPPVIAAFEKLHSALPDAAFL